MEQQRIRMTTELEKYYGKEDWSMTFRAGPDSIGILAECILITSTPKVAGIEINGPGLEYTTLSANIMHCAVVGSDTFRETARNMELLAELTHELSQPDGTIDTMLKFSEPGQSKARDELLADIIAEGEESIADCMDAIEKVKKSFDSWCSLTKALHLALKEARAHKQREKLNVEDEIKKQQTDKELKEEQKKREEVKMQEKHEQMQRTREKKEWYDSNVEKIFMRGGVSALIAAVPEGAVMAPVVIAAGVLVFAHYVTLRGDLLSMEEAQAKRDQEIRELEDSKTCLEAALAQLSKDSKSIKEITEIVGEAVSRVTELQQLIQKFLDFLRDIHGIISYTIKHSKRAYNGFRKKDDFVDLEIKKKVMRNAFDMKTRFIFASKASNVYNAVSSQYVLPTLDILPGLGQLGATADHEMRGEIDELHKMRCKVSSDTDCLARKMHKELKESMADITRDCARVFEELLSEDQDMAA